jgi:hypothetical protein
MAFAFYQDGFVPSLQKVTYSSMAEVVRLAIVSVEPAHPPGQICLGSFEEQVIVIVHETVGIAEPVLLQHFTA